jgi:hypothetical protein
LKKYLAIILGLLFVLGISTSAFAIHAEIPAETQAVVAKGLTQITLGGDLRFRGDYRSNTSDQLDDGPGNGVDTDDHTSHVDARVRFKLDVKISDNTTGIIHWEAGWNWGGDGGVGVYPRGNRYATTGIGLLEGSIQHISGPLGIKVGHMPLKLGNGLFFDHTWFGSDALFVFVNPSKETHLGLLWTKFNEGGSGRFLQDDADGYVLLGSMAGDGWNVGGDITFVDDQSGAGLGDNIHLYNFGLRGDINFGGLTLKGDVEYQTGRIEDATGAGGNCRSGPGVVDCDIAGYAFLAAADYSIGNTTLTASVWYGSGDDDATDKDWDLFINSLSSTVYYTFAYDYRMRTASDTGGSSGVANTMALGGEVSSKLTSALSGKLGIWYLRAAEDVDLNFRYASGAGPLPGDVPDPEKDIGWEIDAMIKYKLDRNLTYTVEGGYLFTGDAWDYIDSQADDAYTIRHVVQLSF